MAETEEKKQEEQTQVEAQPSPVTEQAPDASEQPAPSAPSAPNAGNDATQASSEAQGAAPSEVTPAAGAVQTAQPEKTFTQSQVNELVGKARIEGRESAMKALYDKYGVEDDESLDEMFGNGEKYDDLNEQFESQSKQYSDLQAENALLKSGIAPEKFDDVKAILAYNQMEFTPESIQAMSQTHPEWFSSAQAQAPKMVTPEEAQAMGKPNATPSATPTPSTITKLGEGPHPVNESEDEEAKAMKLFGLN